MQRDVNEHAEPRHGSKMGGLPGLIQDLDNLTLFLEARSLGFLFQIDEEDYPDDMEIETLPFAGGMLYVFVSPQGRTHAFWQST